MKYKKIIPVLLIMIVLSACNNDKRDMQSLIKLQDDIAEVNMVISSGGEEKTYSLTETQIAQVKNWMAIVEIKKVDFSEDEMPSNLNGGKCYNLYSDSFDEFSYFEIGNGEDYIRIDDNWYQINIPMDISFE